MTNTHGSPTKSPPTLDQLFKMFCHPARRRILHTLAQDNPRDEDGFESEYFASDEKIEVFKRELYHNHLPKLNEAGFIDWDRETDTITRGPRFEDIQPLVTLMANHQDELPEGWP